MALLKCSECGREISSEAQSCPGCGKPRQDQRQPPVEVKAGSRLVFVALIVGGIVVVLAGIAALSGLALRSSARTLGGSDAMGVVDRELDFEKIGGKKLGMYLAEKHAGGRVLILTEPRGSDNMGYGNARVHGLKEGLGTKLVVVAEASLEVPADKVKSFNRVGDGPFLIPPLEYWYTAKVFDAVLSTYGGQFDLVVTVIGLPQDARSSAILKGKSCPKIAVLKGSIYDLKGAIMPTMIVAAISDNPKAVYDGNPAPRDLDEAFNKRFLLVTPDNLQQIETQYSDVFRSGK